MRALGEWFWLLQVMLIAPAFFLPSYVARWWVDANRSSLPRLVDTGNFDRDFEANRARRDVEMAYWASGRAIGWTIVIAYALAILVVLPLLVFGRAAFFVPGPEY